MKQLCKICGKEFNTDKTACSKSCAIKLKWQDPEFKAMMKSKMKNVKHAKPASTENYSKARKRVWEDSEYRENKIKSLKENWEDPKFRSKIKEINNEYRSTNKYKKNWSEIQSEIQNRPDVKKKKSIAAKKNWENAEYAEKTIARGFAYKEFKLPSNRVVKLQGYEPFVLTELLEEYDEDDIVIGIKEINKSIGRIKYKFENKESIYFPDFYIKSTNTIIEVKSQWTFEKHKEKNLAKESACKAQGFNFNFIIYKPSKNKK